MSAKESMLLNCGTGEDLRDPWTTKRPNQSILKEINPEYSFKTHADTEALIIWSPDTKS